MCQAADVFSEQLLPKGHGFPLWLPEPDTELDEVQIGDVGYLWEGSFCTLFNPTLPANHPVNKNGVPDGFVPLKFNSNELVRRRDAYLPDGPVCSQTVRRVSAVAQAGTGAIASVAGAQTHLAFECVRNKGGLLVINGGGAVQEVLRPNKTFSEYMNRHHDSWVEFSKERGHDVAPEDIIMVRGWVKASKWTVAAFMDETKYQSLQLEAQAGSIASAGVNLSLSSSSSMSVDHRTGPSRASAPYSVGVAEDAELHKNQCVFLSRYKMRYRKFPWRKIRAEGYKNDESAADDESDDGSSSSETDHEGDFFVEDDCVRTKIFDPVDLLLRYILDNSTCEAAISSDEDLYTLRELGIVDYDRNAMLGQLQRLKPRIEVSESGVGSLSLDPPVGAELLEFADIQNEILRLPDTFIPSDESRPFDTALWECPPWPFNIDPPAYDPIPENDTGYYAVTGSEGNLYTPFGQVASNDYYSGTERGDNRYTAFGHAPFYSNDYWPPLFPSNFPSTPPPLLPSYYAPHINTNYSPLQPRPLTPSRRSRTGVSSPYAPDLPCEPPLPGPRVPPHLHQAQSVALKHHARSSASSRDRYSKEEHLEEPITFMRHDGNYASVADVLHGVALLNGQSVSPIAGSSREPHLSYRVEWPGYPAYTQNLSRSSLRRPGHVPMTHADLARAVAVMVRDCRNNLRGSRGYGPDFRLTEVQLIGLHLLGDTWQVELRMLPPQDRARRERRLLLFFLPFVFVMLLVLFFFFRPFNPLF
ncbi:hypothetical protein BDW22DRAFT_1364574 [Trametopsis cervina]|nr:hypothetical protein BDW22DRAFT_1364574 [Trametopsis cervina]